MPMEFAKFHINQRDDHVPSYFKRRRAESYDFARIAMKLLRKHYKSEKDLVKALQKQNDKTKKSFRVRKKTIKKLLSKKK
jgi:hypothetical protein